MTMGTFVNDTKQWLRSVIRQRKVLITINRSRIDNGSALVAINTLETLLNCYPYENEIYLARFVRQQQGNIELLLPGTGSTMKEKRELEWKEIRTRATGILEKDRTKITIL